MLEMNDSEKLENLKPSGVSVIGIAEEILYAAPRTLKDEILTLFDDLGIESTEKIDIRINDSEKQGHVLCITIDSGGTHPVSDSLIKYLNGIAKEKTSIWDFND